MARTYLVLLLCFCVIVLCNSSNRPLCDTSTSADTNCLAGTCYCKVYGWKRTDSTIPYYGYETTYSLFSGESFRFLFPFNVFVKTKTLLLRV